MENTQDYHSPRLTFLCRLCKMKIITDKNYENMKRAKDFWGEINEIFSYDLNNDKASVHPEFICNICRHKLENYQNELCKVVQTNIATFASHTPHDCTLCSRKRGLVKHKDSLKKSVNQKELHIKQLKRKWQMIFYVLKHIIIIFFMTSDADIIYYFSKFTLSDNENLSMEISIRVFWGFYWRVYIWNRDLTNLSTLTRFSKIYYSFWCTRFFF